MLIRPHHSSFEDERHRGHLAAALNNMPAARFTDVGPGFVNSNWRGLDNDNFLVPGDFWECQAPSQMSDLSLSLVSRYIIRAVRGMRMV